MKTPLASKLQSHVDRQIMAGAVFLVADKRGLQEMGAVGWSHIEAQKAMREDAVFWVASITKPIAAVAFMMLVEEGRVTLDDPVEKYIPGFANLEVLQADGSLRPPSHPVLIREILSHTSGMRFLNSKDRMVIDCVPLETSVEHALEEPLLFDPGAQFLYSNEGTDASGRIIEIVTGVPFETFLQERLFSPLGMVDTTFWPDAEQLSRLAKTYKTKTDQGGLEATFTSHLTYPLDNPARYAAPGGGLFSTARDMWQFSRMLLHEGTLEGKTYLSRESLRRMTSKQTGPGITDSYGFGFRVDGERSYGHGGALKTNLTIDHDQIRVFLVQHGSDWAIGDPGAEFDAEARRLYLNKEPARTLEETQTHSTRAN